jgi:hypothetical protein
VLLVPSLHQLAFMMTGRRPLYTAFLIMVAFGCATPRPALREPSAKTRLTDTPRERMAAIPVPDPAATRENQDQRFGIESARERGETAKQKAEEKRRCVDVVSARQAGKNTPPPCPPAKQ